MAGVGKPDDRQIVDQLVQSFELERKQRRVLHPPDDQRRHLDLRKCRSRQSGSGTVTPGGGTTSLRRPVPVEHRSHPARLRPVGEILPLLGLGNFRQIGMAGEGPARRRHRSPSPRSPSRSPGVRNALMYCDAARWSASSIRLFWKINGCGALTIASRVRRGSPRSAAGQAIAPPQSCPTSAKLSTPSASANAKMSSTNLSVCIFRRRRAAGPSRRSRAGRA